MLTVCTAVHEGKLPFATEADAQFSITKAEKKAVFRDKQRGNRAKRPLRAYQCEGCKNWFVGTAMANGTPMAELQVTVAKHKKSTEMRRRTLAQMQFNGPRIA